MGSIIFIILVLLLLAALPKWPYSKQWGYNPAGVITFFIILLIILVLTGHVEMW